MPIRRPKPGKAAKVYRFVFADQKAAVPVRKAGMAAFLFLISGSDFMMKERAAWLRGLWKRHFILARCISFLFVFFGVTFLTFAVTSLAPSDGAEMYYLSRGITPSPELLAETRAEMGLDQPLLVQYGHWLWNVLHGNLGTSYNFEESVLSQLARKLPYTLALAGAAFLLTAAVSLPLGAVAAVKRNKLTDFLIRAVSFVGVSVPNFWLALLLLYFLAVQLRLFPVIGTGDLRSMALPVLTLVIPLSCSYVRQIRTAFLEEMGKEYVTALRARGISERKIFFSHLLPGALTPVLTLAGMSVGSLLGGAAIVETIFGWPGIGSMVVDAIRVRDYPVIQGYVLWMAAIYLLAGLVTDLFCRMLDPRQRRKALWRKLAHRPEDVPAGRRKRFRRFMIPARSPEGRR